MQARYAIPLLLAATALPLAAAPKPGDYAFQATLEQAEQPLQRVVLPLDILLTLTRADLGDIAVFNAQNRALPRSILRTPRGEDRNTLDLPFHEFGRFLERHSRTVTTREQNLEPGTVTERETTETLAVRSRRSDYLIELAPGDERQDFDRLELEWRHEPADQLLELQVEAGDELDRLRVIQSRKSLTGRESDDAGWRSIDGIPRNAKYLRLKAREGIESFELLRVTGLYRETRPAATLEYELGTAAFEDESGNYYRAGLPSTVQPEALRIVPADDHSVIEGDLYALREGQRDKRLIRRGFRQHNIAGEGIRPSPAIALPGHGLAEIRFTTRTELAREPRVALIYPQYEVIFLGDGNPPYRLAWGNHESAAYASGLGGLLDGDLRDAREDSVAVGLGSTREAGGSARLRAPVELPWMKWLLWTLLIAAALVTGRMALRLYREMNSTDSG
jgi:hypothetical protein